MEYTMSSKRNRSETSSTSSTSSITNIKRTKIYKSTSSLEEPFSEQELIKTMGPLTEQRLQEMLSEMRQNTVTELGNKIDNCLQALESRVMDLESKNSALKSEIEVLKERVVELEDKTVKNSTYDSELWR